jgi:hypothetical protein
MSGYYVGLPMSTIASTLEFCWMVQGVLTTLRLMFTNIRSWHFGVLCTQVKQIADSDKPFIYIPSGNQPANRQKDYPAPAPFNLL